MSNKLSSAIDLRERAQAQLLPPAAHKPQASASDALRVLFDLASSPDTAPDALALLHELQVHQVELDLQAEDLHTAVADLESALARQIQLYDAAPVAYCIVDAETRLRDVNATGLRWLGKSREVLLGQRLDIFFDAAGAAALRGLLAAGQCACACTLSWDATGHAPGSVCASIDTDPAGGGFLVVLSAMPKAN
ncbi:MAG: PAS domain-containing protein [Desulfobacterales bacterium]|nr:PAS domain-containing protein [Desulfobacterales bacterium]